LGGKLEEAKGDAAAVHKNKVIEQLDAFANRGLVIRTSFPHVL
jgi:hypothetical protein